MKTIDENAANLQTALQVESLIKVFPEVAREPLFKLAVDMITQKGMPATLEWLQGVHRMLDAIPGSNPAADLARLL